MPGLTTETADRLEDLLVEHGGYQTHDTRASMARILAEEGATPPHPYRSWTPQAVRAALVEIGAAKAPNLTPDLALLERLIELHDSGLGRVQIAARIGAEGFRRFDGRPFSWQSVNALLRTLGIEKQEPAESAAYCSCGCGTALGPDSRGRPRRFVKGHNRRKLGPRKTSVPQG